MIRQRSHLGRLTLLMVLLFLCVLLCIQPSEAQNSSIPRDKAVLADGQRVSQRSSSLNLTETQKKSLEDLRCMYAKEAIPMRAGLFALRIELRHLLSDPNVQPQILFEKQRKISALQAKLEELSLCYQVKARSVFTKEQLERLPQGWAFEMGLGYEIPIMDTGRRSRKGLQ
jgi:Spy/CpxP family protein refolding chaperone